VFETDLITKRCNNAYAADDISKRRWHFYEKR